MVELQSDLNIVDLKPLKVLITGPPASGKTKLAEQLCRRYGAHYLNVRVMIQETLSDLKENIDRVREKMLQRSLKKASKYDKEGTEGEEDIFGEEDRVEGEEEELMDDDNLPNIDEWQDQMKYIINQLEKSEDRKLMDDLVIRLLRTFLMKPLCQTRGFVLDNYPKNAFQAKELFGLYNDLDELGEGATTPNLEVPVSGEDASTVERELPGNTISKIMPDYVVCLKASDEFLCQRVMKLPQKFIQGTHLNEVGMLRRLAEYHQNSKEDQSVLKFFDDIGIHPIIINLVKEDTQEEMDLDSIFDYVCEIFGEPIPGFGLTPEEEEAIRKLEKEQQRLLEEEERLERQLLEKRVQKEYEEKMEKWNETLEKLQLEEEKVLAAQSEPLRFYLMKYIFPTLSKGLVEVAKVKPEDPVDFLAEYLFKENPEGKMFDPSYTCEGERIVEQYEKEVKPIVDQAQASEQ